MPDVPGGGQIAQGGSGVGSVGSNLGNLLNQKVIGESTSNTDAAVTGQNIAAGPGVFGQSTGGEGVHGETQSAVMAAVAGANKNPTGTGAGVYGFSQNSEGVHGETQSALTAGVAGIQLNPNGTGAGVYGESRGKGPAGFFKGNVQVTGDILLINADCAEEFDVSKADSIVPGTVMVIDTEDALRASAQAYDKRVAGVVSGAGDCKPAIILGKQEAQERRMPIALVGKVFCKVDARYSPIQVGDLLTTSPTPGHAMKADDPLKAFGAVIGKALRPLPEGQGLIPILIALQ